MAVHLIKYPCTYVCTAGASAFTFYFSHHVPTPPWFSQLPMQQRQWKTKKSVCIATSTGSTPVHVSSLLQQRDTTHLVRGALDLIPSSLVCNCVSPNFTFHLVARGGSEKIEVG
uniref:Uncharacterized protein n=1 Tax=Trypanosoma congolense (strain IL3000) TaxID=1068625 RepID=G0UR69_TRYCI|nr:hypothetical protein, unlikely [Trypanosoma congolense IL3000]